MSCLKELKLKNIKQVKANSTVCLIRRTKKRQAKYETQTVYDFDLNQHKTTYDDWNSAFEKAIIKRTKK